MTATPPVIEAADAFLERLVRLDLQAAEHVHACLLDTVKPAEVAELSRAYARASRCVRQTLALHAKLKIDRERAVREAADHEAAHRPGGGLGLRPAFDPRAYAVDERFGTLHDAVHRVISKAADGDEARHTELAHRFSREADDWVEADDFLDLDPEAHVLEACRRLGLPDPLARAWRDLPKPTFHPDPEGCEDDDDDDEDEDEDEADDDAPLAQSGPSQRPDAVGPPRTGSAGSG